MNLSLSAHPDKYNLTWLQTPLLLWPLPYAKRHCSLSTTGGCLHAMGHLTIAALEAVPVVGSLVALIERIVVYVHSKCFNNRESTPQSKPLPPLSPRKPLSTNARQEPSPDSRHVTFRKKLGPSNLEKKNPVDDTDRELLDMPMISTLDGLIHQGGEEPSLLKTEELSDTNFENPNMSMCSTAGGIIYTASSEDEDP